MVPAIVYMTVAGFFRPIVFMALKKMKSGYNILSHSDFQDV